MELAGICGMKLQKRNDLGKHAAVNGGAAKLQQVKLGLSANAKQFELAAGKCPGLGFLMRLLHQNK